MPVPFAADQGRGQQAAAQAGGHLRTQRVQHLEGALVALQRVFGQQPHHDPRELRLDAFQGGRGLLHVRAHQVAGPLAPKGGWPVNSS